MATEMPTAIRAYSIAAVPRSSFLKRATRDHISRFPPAQTGLPSPLTARLLLCLRARLAVGLLFDEGEDLRPTPHIEPRAAASG